MTETPRQSDVAASRTDIALQHEVVVRDGLLF